MLKQVMLFLAVAAASVVSAVEPVWKNPEVNQQNREPRRANYFAYESRALAEKATRRLRPVICLWRECGSSTL